MFLRLTDSICRAPLDACPEFPRVAVGAEIHEIKSLNRDSVFVIYDNLGMI